MKRWDLIGHRRYLYLASLLVVLLAGAALAGNMAVGRPPLNWGVDFTGGTLLLLRFEDRTVTTGRVRSVLTPLRLGEAMIQQTPGTGDVSIRTRYLSAAERNQVLGALRRGVGPFMVLSVDDVGPKIGRELRNIAILGVVIGLILQVVYVTIRFRSWHYALAADVALVHDVLVVLGAFALTRATVDSAFVAVLLTVVGYSINDTIVVFDRIRENLNLRTREPFPELVNRSILESLVRSLGTSATTLLAIGAVYVFGGPTIRDFAFGLCVAVLTGAYSSIGVASPLLVDLAVRGERMALVAPGAPSSARAETVEAGSRRGRRTSRV
ncbi:MAG: protein translocase subunit SecF [Armatimonadetes bacterium]|nr:protein translocase subunit SecF [Armatimonadota bacterium]MDW8152967.1 protein translocase subunit SecF [Armatimonadota bacterium]